MKRIIIGIILGALFTGGYIALPEIQVKKNRKQAIETVSIEMGVSPKVSNFLVNTKFGRKVSTLFLKSKVKKELNTIKKNIKRTTRRKYSNKT